MMPNMSDFTKTVNSNHFRLLEEKDARLHQKKAQFSELLSQDKLFINFVKCVSDSVVKYLTLNSFCIKHGVCRSDVSEVVTQDGC